MSIGIPIDHLITQVMTSDNAGRGTFAHPKVAYNFAIWASPEFAVMVSEWN